MDLLFGNCLGLKILCLPIFINITEIVKTFKSLYGFGGNSLKIIVVFMDFNYVLKSVTVRPKSFKLGQMANLNVTFHDGVN